MYAERAQLFLIKLKGSYPVDTTINKIKEYIAVRNVDMGQLENETDIIENRLIDSLQFVEFIMYIEEVGDIEVDMETLNIEDFRSLSSIGKMISRLGRKPIEVQ